MERKLQMLNMIEVMSGLVFLHNSPFLPLSCHLDCQSSFHGRLYMVRPHASL